MTDTQRFEQVRDIIADTLEINEANIAPDMNLKDDLGADDIDLFELVCRLEKELDFDAGGAWEDWQIVQDIIDTWKEKEAGE